MVYGKYNKKRSIFSFKKSFFSSVGRMLRESFPSSAKRTEKFNKMNPRIRIIGNFRICLLFFIRCRLHFNTKDKNCPFLKGEQCSLSTSALQVNPLFIRCLLLLFQHCSGWMMFQSLILSFKPKHPLPLKRFITPSYYHKHKYLSSLCQ